MVLFPFAVAAEPASAFVTEDFIEFCVPVLDDVDATVARLRSAKWDESGSERNTNNFKVFDFQNADRGTKVYIQSYSFSQGSFRQCGAYAQADFSLSDVGEVASHFNIASGEIMRGAEGRSSAMYLLAGRPDFTSLNVIYGDGWVRIIIMQTRYLGPEKH